MVKPMLRFDLNSARSHVGRKVNLHLKDGSVIVNVLVVDATPKEDSHSRSALYFKATENKKMRIQVKEIEWVERLDTHLLMA